MQKQFVEIRYESAERLRFVSTHSSDSIYDLKGLYLTEEECVADRDNQMSIFTEQTGLEPFAAYCFKERGDDDLPWAVRMDAIGLSEIVPLFYSVHVGGKPKSPTEEDLVLEIDQQIANIGGKLVNVGFRSNAIMSTITIFFYGESKPLWNAHRINTNSSVEDCETELVQIKQYYSDAGKPYYFGYCGSTSTSPSRVALYSVVADTLMHGNQSAESYESFSECWRNRETILDSYQANDATVFGGICEFDYNTRVYRIRLLKNY
jgi:hypothetical protein